MKTLNDDNREQGAKNSSSQVKEDLPCTEKLTREILNAIPSGLHMYHLDGERRLIFDYANRAADMMLGTVSSGRSGLPVEEAFPSMLLDAFTGNLKDTAETGIPWKSGAAQMEAPLTNFYEMNAFQIAPGRVAVLFTDVNEYIIKERELRKRESEFRNLFEATPSGMALIVDRIFTRVSSRASLLTGYSAEELVGKPTRIIYASDEAYEMAESELYGSIKNGDLGVCEVTLRKKNGNIADMLIYAFPFDLNDYSKGIVVTIEDLSQKKKIENEKKKLQEDLIQAQKMDSIGRLAGGIAHDFNNLLTAIMGHTELALLKTNAESNIFSNLKTVMQAAESAAELTGQLLSFSRKQIINPRPVNLNNIIENMNRMLPRLIGENIILKSILYPDLHTVRVDISQMQQIIMNLSVNARDSMPEGGLLQFETSNVLIDSKYHTFHPYHSTGRFVLLSVTDSGTGINDEIKSHIFEPFFTTKPSGKGTGLGLATVYGAVKQNGGFIEVYSEEGHGTCFKIYFPSIDDTAGEIAATLNTDVMPSGVETILLVEDNPHVLQFAESVLKMQGYKVLTSHNGEKALKIVNEQGIKINLLITDIVLPRMNGKILSEKIREKDSSVRVLFNSGYTENAIVAHGILNKGLHFISKPYSAYELSIKVRKVLDDKDSDV